MKNLDPNMTHAEIKLSMIEDILQMDFNNPPESIINTKGVNKLFFKFRKMDYEISEREKNDEVDNLNAIFSSLLMPTSFFIEDMQTIFEDNVFSSDCIHIYFIKNSTEISLLFRFNINEDNEDEDNITFGEEEKIYELKERKLIEVSAGDAISYIEAFRTLYKNQTFDENTTDYTQYVTFHYRNIIRNFKKFDQTVQLITAAKQDVQKNDKMRLNLITQMSRSSCKIPKTPNSIVYFNIGNMQP